MKDILVVKLGGSFAAGGRLRPWLNAIMQGAGRTILVPGGGPFADAVRAAQQVMGFDDAAAHQLALAAMRQYGLALAALEPGLVPAGSEGEIAGALRGGQVPVWLPEAMALRDSAIAPCWDVTSDSLALWLAVQVQARAVILVKQVKPEGSTAAQLAEAGIVDRAFPDYLAKMAVPACIAGPDDMQGLGVALSTGHMEWLFAIAPH